MSPSRCLRRTAVAAIVMFFAGFYAAIAYGARLARQDAEVRLDKGDPG